MVKAFNVTFDYVLHELSYANILLYCASLPSYRSPKDKTGKSVEEVINGDDPTRQEEINKLFDESKRNL